MANQPCRIAIQVANPNSVAGELDRGHVYIETDAKVDPSVLQQQQGIRLILEGQERTQIITRTPDEDHRPATGEKRRLVTEEIRSDTVLFRTEQAIASFENRSFVAGRQYEFPFELQLPDSLPSSTRCVQINSRNECDTGEIVYTLSACIDSSSSGRGYREVLR
jgi:hypothetical protein